MSGRVEFEREHPDVHILSADQAGRVDLVMGALGWLGDEEQVTTCVDLGGVASTVMRVELQELRGGWRTAVLKQSLPWMRTRESVAMPGDRAGAELRFYRRVTGLADAAKHMPRLLGGDETRSVLLLEDFRRATNLMSLYRGGSLARQTARTLGRFLRALRRERDGDRDEDLQNVEMKALSHRMVFQAPFDGSNAGGNGLGPDGPAPDEGALDDVEPGLGAAASRLRSDGVFKDAAAALGRRFLRAADCLVHGAFHPANWLLLPNGDVRVVDPQYGGWGEAEFDVGTGVAHLLLAQQPEEVVSAFLSAATAPVDGCGQASADSEAAHSAGDPALIARYAGIEMARRLIGGGQLPLEAAAGFRSDLLETAGKAVVSGRLEVLET